MTLKELCIKRELAVRMKELGWPQEESLFVWGKNTKLTVNKDKWFLTVYRNHCLIWYAAPTLSEIVEKTQIHLTLYLYNGLYHVDDIWNPVIVDKVSFANAAGKYWCWLKEKSYGV